MPNCRQDYQCKLHPKIPRLLHCQNRLWFLQYIFLIFGFRVLKSNQIVLLHCPDMLIPFGVIWNLHKKIVLQNSKILNIPVHRVYSQLVMYLNHTSSNFPVIQLYWHYSSNIYTHFNCDKSSPVGC